MFKKKLVTYLLWLFGGIFGLHHIYLGRYKQAFIWYGTFGGFLIGCIADLTRMSDYLDYANSNDEYFASLLKRMNRLKTPSFFSVYRIFGAIFAGSFFGYVLQYSLPLDYADIYPHVYNIFYYLAPFACSIGVYLVSTESFTKCNFFWPLIGSYIGAIPHYYQHPKAMIFCAITSTIFTNWKLEWDNKKIIDSKDKKTKPKKSKFSKELFILIICASLYTCVAASFFIHNATVTVEGETVTVKEGIINFFNSKLYQDLKASVVRLWYIYKMYGFQKLKDEFLFGESHKLARAYSVSKLKIFQITSFYFSFFFN